MKIVLPSIKLVGVTGLWALKRAWQSTETNCAAQESR